MRITATLVVPDSEISFSFARSSGPGGQNVNKVNSKAVLHWDLIGSPSIPGTIRNRFLSLFGTRVTTEGFVVITSDRYRDQELNRDDCLQKLSEMLRSAATPPRVRRKTRPTKASREERKSEKRIRGSVKRLRGRVRGED